MGSHAADTDLESVALRGVEPGDGRGVLARSTGPPRAAGSPVWLRGADGGSAGRGGQRDASASVERRGPASRARPALRRALPGGPAAGPGRGAVAAAPGGGTQ